MEKGSTMSVSVLVLGSCDQKINLTDTCFFYPQTHKKQNKIFNINKIVLHTPRSLRQCQKSHFDDKQVRIFWKIKYNNCLYGDEARGSSLIRTRVKLPYKFRKFLKIIKRYLRLYVPFIL